MSSPPSAPLAEPDYERLIRLLARAVLRAGPWREEHDSDLRSRALGGLAAALAHAARRLAPSLPIISIVARAAFEAGATRARELGQAPLGPRDLEELCETLSWGVFSALERQEMSQALHLAPTLADALPADAAAGIGNLASRALESRLAPQEDALGALALARRWIHSGRAPAPASPLDSSIQELGALFFITRAESLLDPRERGSEQDLARALSLIEPPAPDFRSHPMDWGGPKAWAETVFLSFHDLFRRLRLDPSLARKADAFEAALAASGARAWLARLRPPASPPSCHELLDQLIPAVTRDFWGDHACVHKLFLTLRDQRGPILASMEAALIEPELSPGLERSARSRL